MNKRLIIPIAVATTVLICYFIRDPLSNHYYKKGLKAKNGWHLHEALRNFKRSAFLQREHFRARLEIGICLQLLGEFKTSAREFDAVAAFPNTDKIIRSRLQCLRGINYFNLKQPEKAIQLFQQSIELAEINGDRLQKAESLIHTSRVLYHLKGQRKTASDYLHQALLIARSEKEPLIEADALRNLGIISHWFDNDLDAALSKYYMPALQTYKHLNEQQRIAITLSNIALVYMDQGDHFQFLKYQHESMAIKGRIGDSAGLSDSYCYMGHLYEQMKNYRKAMDFYSQSLTLSAKIGYVLTQNEVENSLAVVYMHLQDYEKAIVLLNRLLKQEAGNPTLVKYRLYWLARCYGMKGEFEKAITYTLQALDQDEKVPGNVSRTTLLAFLSEAYLAVGHEKNALHYLSEAKRSNREATQMFWPNEIQIHITEAALMESQGQNTTAVNELLEAAALETKVYESMDSVLLQSQENQIYDRLFRLLLEKEDVPGRNQIAFDVLEHLKSRSLRIFLLRTAGRSPRLANLENVKTHRVLDEQRNTNDSVEKLREAYAGFENAVLQSELRRPQYNLIHKAKPAELQYVQKNLDNRTVLLMYVSTDARVYCLALTQTRIQSVVLPVKTKDLATKVKLFRSLIFNESVESSKNGDWQELSEYLRSLLIEPLEESRVMEGVRRVGIIPYGPLHDLPFAALSRTTGERRFFLIEDYTIFNAPSATYFAHLQVQPAKKRSHEPSRVLSIGRKGSDREDLSILKFAVDEATTVSRSLGGVLLLNGMATESEIKRLLPGMNIAHFATHAVTEPDMPLLSRLMLEKTNQDDGVLTVSEILDLDLQADLVVLAACDSALSHSLGSYGHSEADRIGLIEAFLNAGAKTVLATLLPVQDGSTVEFVKIFYGNLKSMNTAEALAETQRAFIAGRIPTQDHDPASNFSLPHFWAPFVLTGDYH